MIQKNRSIHNKFLKGILKPLWYAAAILAIPLIALSVVYFSSSNFIRNQEYTKNLLVLENCTDRMNEVFESMDSVAYNFSNDTRITTYLQLPRIEEDLTIISDVLQAQKNLQSYEVFNDAIDLIQVYSLAHGSIIDSRTSGLELDRYYGSVVTFYSMGRNQWEEELLKKYHAGDFYPGMEGHLFESAKDRWIIYAKSIPTGMNRNHMGNLIFMLDEQYFLNFFEDTQYKENGFLYVWDIQDQSLLAENASSVDEGHIQEHIWQTTESSGYYIHENMLITYLKDPEYQLTLTVGIPLSVVMQPINTISGVMKVLWICTIIVAGLIALLTIWRFTRREQSIQDILSQYNRTLDPVDYVKEVEVLVQNNNEIMEILDQQVSMQKAAMFYNLLLGDVESNNDMLDTMRVLNVDPMMNYYVVLLLNLNEQHDDETLESSGLQKLYVREVLWEELGENGIIYDIKPDQLVILLTSSDTEYMNCISELDTKVKYVIRKLQNTSGISVTISGDIVDHYKKIPLAYHHATMALAYKTRNRYWSVQWYNKAVATVDDLLVYPVTMEEKLIQAIEAGDIEETARNIRMLRKLNPEIFIEQNPEISDSLLQAMVVTCMRVKMSSDESKRSILDKINEIRMRRDAKESTEALLDRIFEIIYESTYQNSSAAEQKQDRMKRQILQYVKENYQDSQLSLTMMGDAMGFKEIYLSKIFKQLTGENFSKYVERLRMEEANRLIDKTNHTITEIAEMVGYNSPQVFRRAYKRIYGVSPSEGFKTK